VFKLRIGIIGAGIVGGAIEKCFFPFHEIFIHDPVRGTNLEDVTNNCDIAYVAVPTPQMKNSGECDTSIVEDVLSKLPDGFRVIIKSTVEPGTTQRLHSKYPKLKIAYSPEFLVERRHLEDFKNQEIIVVGTHHKEIADLVFQHHKIAGVLLESAELFTVTPTEAELVKYTINTFYAWKVIFSNQMYDICSKMGEDWNVVKDIVTIGKRQPIGPTHLNPIMGLKRGFGGKCLPKDSMALIRLAEKLNCKYEMMNALHEDNNRLRKIITGVPSDVTTLDD